MLSHLDEQGRPAMVDVTPKVETARHARAEARVYFPPDIGVRFENGELHGKKGPVFATAIIAGTMAVKRTSDLIPFCHPLAIERCRFNLEWRDGEGVTITCDVGVFGKTGVEMEALTGASIAALTVYDMCKALSHRIEIRDVRLIKKEGGKSGL